jgi:hypothetical protein
MTSIVEQARKEFLVLDESVSKYWRDDTVRINCRHLLRCASTEALNMYCEVGWTILTWVFWRLRGNEGEIELLETLLGSEVAAEDHSRLRLDKCIFKSPFKQLDRGVFGIVHPKSNYVKSNSSHVSIFSPADVLRKRKHDYDNSIVTASYQSHLDIALTLLENASQRIRTYPKRLMETLTEVCTHNLPTKILYVIIADYLCH